jgi:hypothetical protein
VAKVPPTDPRFDPRFQRGYDGPQPVVPETPAAPPAHSRDERTAEPFIEASSDAASAERDVDDLNAEAFWAPPRRNPYGLALLVGGLVMILVGCWLVWTVVTASSYPNGYDRGEQTFALIQQQITPALLICGVLAIVGWLVLGALAASDRKPE